MNLRSQLSKPPIIVAPGVYDPLTALIATQASFKTLYISGAAIAYTRLGRPDIGLVSISEVARRSGVASSALRFYEERGLIASERADSGHRRYPRSVLRRIAFIVFAQKIGLSLEEIGAELAKPPEGRVRPADVIEDAVEQHAHAALSGRRD